MTTVILGACLLGVVVLVAGVVAIRRGVLYRARRSLAWRQAKSRRDRGTMRAGGPSDGGGADPTSGASF